MRLPKEVSDLKSCNHRRPLLPRGIAGALPKGANRLAVIFLRPYAVVCCLVVFLPAVIDDAMNSRIPHTM